MLARLRDRNEWKFFAVLPQADRRLALLWWLVALCRGLLPALFAVAMGGLVGAVERGAALAGPLALAGVVFVLLQLLAPLHQALGANLGDRTAAWLYDRLTAACNRPPGLAHLEDPTLTGDLTVARDFDQGVTGPPLFISMDFIAGGLVDLIAGLACAALLAAYAWWAPLVLAGGWLAGHALAAARERRMARPRDRRGARGAARGRLRLPVGGRSAGQQGVAAVRSHELDARPLRRQPDPAPRAAVRRDAAPRAAHAAERADRERCERRRLLVTGRRRSVREPRPGRGRGLRPGGGGNRVDRVRRAQLGHRRVRGAGRRGAASRGGDGAEGRAAAGRP